LLGDAATTGALIEDPDLHDHLCKGLYQADLGSQFTLRYQAEE
jgi:hypothetical protein